MSIYFDRHKKTSGSYTNSTNQFDNGSFTTTHDFSHEYPQLETWGQSTSNFNRKKKSGALLRHTHFKQVSASHEGSAGDLHRDFGGSNTLDLYGYDWVCGRGYHIRNVAHSPDTSFAATEVQRAAASIYGAGHDSLTSVLELNKVPKLFKTAAQRMKRLHSERGRKFSKQDFNDSWAEGRYGFRTLAYDIRDLHSAITDFDENRKIWTEKSGYSYTQESTYVKSDPWSGGMIVGEFTDVSTHSIRGAVAAMFKPARYRVDPVQTAWELVPYSFVVDWVVSVGDALAAHALIASAEGLTASIGVHTVSKRTVEVSAEADAGVNFTYNSSYNGTYEYTTRSPTVVTARPAIRGRQINPSYITDLRSFAKRF